MSKLKLRKHADFLLCRTEHEAMNTTTQKEVKRTPYDIMIVPTRPRTKYVQKNLKAAEN